MRSRGARGERGATLIEIAFVLPMLFLLIKSIVDFGIYFYVQHTVQFATREGARLALVGGTLTDAGGQSMSRVASIVQRVRERAAVAVDPSRVAISIYPVSADGSDPAGWEGRLDAGGPGSLMRVRASVPYVFVTPALHLIMPDGGLPAHAQATFRNELFDPTPETP